jgi:hypothetical protein
MKPYDLLRLPAPYNALEKGERKTDKISSESTMGVATENSKSAV